MKFQDYVKIKNEMVGGPEMDPAYQKNKSMNEMQLHALNEKFDQFAVSLAKLSDQAIRGRLWRALQPFVNEFNNVLENM